MFRDILKRRLSQVKKLIKNFNDTYSVTVNDNATTKPSTLPNDDPTSAKKSPDERWGTYLSEASDDDSTLRICQKTIVMK